MASTMGSLTARLPVWVAALWWASLTTIGFLVVPMLFIHLPTPAMAGGMAAKLFTAQTWVSVACGGFLLIFSSSKQGFAHAQRVQAAIIFILLGLLLALLVEFAVAPRIVARSNLKLWHSVGTGMYLLQWISAAVVFWRITPKQ